MSPRCSGASLGVALATLLALGSTACGAGATSSAGADVDAVSSSRPLTARDSPDTVTWLDVDASGSYDDVASLTLLTGHLDLEQATDQVRIELDHARVVTIPDVCAPSTVTTGASAIVGPDLVCVLAPGTDSVTFTAIVVGRTGEEVGGRVVASRGLEERTGAVDPRTISGGTATLSPDLRLLSSPDFLNGDIGDLADGPGFWADMPRDERTSNSTNDAYERALDLILDDWQALDPIGVLVAGDLTDGRWGYDDSDSGNFGPVDTPRQQRRALRRAARTYYPQWQQRFTDHDLSVFPAMGDHEYGDNPWPHRKRDLAADYKAEYARAFTTDATGTPLFTDHPRGPARLTAYAGRPSPDVQVVTLDVFDITPEEAKIEVDRQQLSWLRDVLRQARRDDVEWVVVQAHTPILYPVRARDSSMLHYPRGSDSKLWKVFARFGVDLYLAGEVHDTTATEADGIVQITHGGIFQFSLTTALVIDVYGDRLYVTLRDYDMTHTESAGGERLWETRRGGMPLDVEVADVVSTIGTATIVGRGGRAGGARLANASGVLVATTDAD